MHTKTTKHAQLHGLIAQGRRKQFADGQAQFDVNDESGNNSRAKRAAKFWIYRIAGYFGGH